MFATPRSQPLLALTSLFFVLALAPPITAQRTPVVTSERALATHTTAGHVPRGTMVVGAPGAVTPEGFTLAPWSLPKTEPIGWSRVAPTSFGPRFSHRVVAVDARLFVTGGADKDYVVTSRTESYDPATDTWSERAPMQYTRQAHASAAAGGKVLVFGGFPSSVPPLVSFDTAEAFEPVTDNWSSIAPLPTARAGMTASVVDGKIYVIGGISSPGIGNDLGTVEVYDPQSDSWASRAPMPTARSGHVAVVVAGRIHVLGGEIYAQQSPNGIHEIYDPATDTWASGAALPMPMNEGSAGAFGARIFVVGGVLSGPNPVQVFHATTNTWTTSPPTTAPHFSGDAVAVRGRLYVVEGADWNHQFPKSQQGVEVLDLELPLFVRD